jgi:hypothetical protein
MRLKSQAFIIALAVLAVASSNCICINYFNPPMQWYNYSYDPAPNVTIGMNIYTLGSQPITILDSDSGKINISTYSYYSGPHLYQRLNDTHQNIYFFLPGTDTVNTGIKIDTLLYLPHGPNYTLIIWNIANGESPVATRYAGGNLTMWLDDPDHKPVDLYQYANNGQVSYS